jgi:hypothetical protein
MLDAVRDEINIGIGKPARDSATRGSRMSTPSCINVSSELDMAYFEQRCAFNPEEDLSVVQDIQNQAPSAVTSFSSVGLDQLQRRNEQMAELSGFGTFASATNASHSSSRMHAKIYQPVRPSRVLPSSPDTQRVRRQSSHRVYLK